MPGLFPTRRASTRTPSGAGNSSPTPFHSEIGGPTCHPFFHWPRATHANSSSSSSQKVVECGERDTTAPPDGSLDGWMVGISGKCHIILVQTPSGLLFECYLTGVTGRWTFDCVWQIWWSLILWIKPLLLFSLMLIVLCYLEHSCHLDLQLPALGKSFTCGRSNCSKKFIQVRSV